MKTNDVHFNHKLSHLVPNPECDIEDGVITRWYDPRPQPSDAEIAAVLPADVRAARAEAEAVEDLSPDYVSDTLFDHENRLRALEGQPPLTRAQFLTALPRTPRNTQRK